MLVVVVWRWVYHPHRLLLVFLAAVCRKNGFFSAFVTLLFLKFCCCVRRYFSRGSFCVGLQWFTVVLLRSGVVLFICRFGVCRSFGLPQCWTRLSLLCSWTVAVSLSFYCFAGWFVLVDVLRCQYCDVFTFCFCFCYMKYWWVVGLFPTWFVRISWFWFIGVEIGLFSLLMLERATCVEAPCWR